MSVPTNSQNISFPQKLFNLIESEDPNIIGWCERGLSFRVIDIDRFAEEIVPKYFRHSKMTSFQRQLNLYGFRRVTKGDDAGSYFHPKFQRGRRDLVSEVKRLPGKEMPIARKNDVSTMDQRTSSRLTQYNKMSIHSDTENIANQDQTRFPMSGQLHSCMKSDATIEYCKGPLTKLISTEVVPIHEPEKDNKGVLIPILERNFSTTIFDNENRLAMVPSLPILSRQNSLIDCFEDQSKPPNFNRDESDSWVKLGTLGTCHDEFDFESVFREESSTPNKSKTEEDNLLTF